MKKDFVSTWLEESIKQNKLERELKSEPSPWIVNIIGYYKQGEISIVRKNNLHGIQSWGWQEVNQKLIFHVANDRAPSKELWDFLVDQADVYCSKLNSKA